MAYEIRGMDVSLPAAADLSAKQYLAMKVDNTGSIAVAGAGEFTVGVLQDKPSAATRIGQVRVAGITKMVAGGVVTAGDLVAPDAAGKAKTAVKASSNTSDAGAASDPLAGSNVLGVALDAAANAGELITVLLLSAGAVPTTNA
jgi:hypothetical protein